MSSVTEAFTNSSTTYIKRSFQEIDQTIPYRFVGSYEYCNALESFSKLLNISTPEEIPVYDIILNDRPEFTFFNGANTAFPSKPDLRKADPFQRKQYYDSFQKKGLAAMMALARIELAATTSLYGSFERPFEAIVTGNFGLEEYVEVLSDDVVAHMKSLAQEPGFEAVTKRSYKIDTWTLAYLRRLKLIRDMLKTLSEVGDASVKTRIRPYDKELAVYERRLLNNVASQTMTESYTQSETETRTKGKGRKIVGVSSKVIRDCDALVQSGSTRLPTRPPKKKISAGDAVLRR